MHHRHGGSQLAADGGAKTPQELTKNLATAFGKADKKAFLACFYTPDELTKRLANDEADKAITFARLQMALNKVNKKLSASPRDYNNSQQPFTLLNNFAWKYKPQPFKHPLKLKKKQTSK